MKSCKEGIDRSYRRFGTDNWSKEKYLWNLRGPSWRVTALNLLGLCQCLRGQAENRTAIETVFKSAFDMKSFAQENRGEDNTVCCMETNFLQFWIWRVGYESACISFQHVSEQLLTFQWRWFCERHFPNRHGLCSEAGHIICQNHLGTCGQERRTWYFVNYRLRLEPFPMASECRKRARYHKALLSRPILNQWHTSP